MSLALSGERVAGASRLSCRSLRTRSVIAIALSAYRYLEPAIPQNPDGGRNHVIRRRGHIRKPILPPDPVILAYSQPMVGEEVYLRGHIQLVQEANHRPEVLFVVVHPGYEWDSDGERGSSLWTSIPSNPPQIFQDPAVVDTCEGLVAILVHELQIEQKVGGQRGKLPEGVRMDMAAGVQDDVQIPLPATLQELPKKLGLGKWLTPGKGHAPPGFVEIDPVVLHEVQDLTRGFPLARQFQGARETNIHTGSMELAAIPMNSQLSLGKRERLMGTRGYAIPAERASIR
jgi:hypothetical protein